MLDFLLEMWEPVQDVPTASTVIHCKSPSHYPIEHLESFIKWAGLVLRQIVLNVSELIFKIIVKFSFDFLSCLVDDFINLQYRSSILFL